jgi:hypothetical protein
MDTWKICALGVISFALLWMAGQKSGDPAGSGTPDMLARELALDASQKRKVTSILEDLRESARPIQAELQQVRDNLVRALKDGREVDVLNRRQVVAYARLSAAESDGLAKIFAVLNAQQKSRATTVPARIGSILQIRPAQPERKYRQAAAAPERKHLI